MQRIRVPAGFVLLPFVLILARPSYISMLAGVPIAAAGLAMRAWAAGYLRKNERLATRGPYSYTRNPLYLGTLILGAGAAVCTGNPWLVGIFAVLYSLIYLPVMSAEVQTMRLTFPAEYPAYSREVPLLLPKFWARYQPLGPEHQGGDHSDELRFDSTLYFRNREYRAALGFAIVVVLLALKMLLLK
jgi:protein-S-isoprenylcysteine O-methyltransferase Ste14